MGANFELDLRAHHFLKRCEHYANAELDRQYNQLARGLDDLLDSILNSSPENEWRTSISVFAEHWAERGLQLSERTLGAIAKLIEDELPPIEQIRDTFAQASPDSIPSSFLLAAAPRSPNRGNRPTPSKKRLPQGEWVSGTAGNGVLRLAEPIKLKNGTLVSEIPFRDGMPIFDKWAVQGKEIFIAMTGEQSFDQKAAQSAWKATNPNIAVDDRYAFHHDGQVVRLDKYDNKTIFAGRMQVIPKELNEIPHIGSASIAREFRLDEDIARKVNELAIEGRGPLAGRLRKTLMKRARQVRRLIPIVGGLLTLIYFADDVEAHGIGGAVARATPVLGDILAVYDLGSDLAADIRASGIEQIERAEADANDPVRKAHEAAERATANAFNEVAGRIAFKLAYSPDETDESNLNKLIDAIKQPLAEFRGEAYTAYFLKIHGRATTAEDIEIRLERAKGKLKTEIEHQLQLKFAPPPTSFH